jgi:transcriptional regulator with XRE-family HTH domain
MIGKNLERLVREKGVKLRDVARATGISIGTLSKIQSGQEPKASTLHKLAKYFGCTMEYLISGEEPSGKKKLEDLISQFAPDFIEVFRDTFRVTIERKLGK